MTSDSINRGAAIGAACIVALLGQGQSARAQLEFDAASVKESREIERDRLSLTQAGVLTARHMKPTALIAFAFELQDFQLAGAPDWSDRTFYDITARPASTVTRAQGREMLRTLLIKRFNLKFHRETRQLNGFALVRASSAQGLKTSNVDCEVTVSSARECRDSVVGDGYIKIAGASMSSLIAVLLPEVNAPIEDRMMLTGRLDIELRWSRDPAASAELPSIYTAIREQLGLKLEPQRVPGNVFVIESVQRPLAD